MKIQNNKPIYKCNISYSLTNKSKYLTEDYYYISFTKDCRNILKDYFSRDMVLEETIYDDEDSFFIIFRKAITQDKYSFNLITSRPKYTIKLKNKKLLGKYHVEFKIESDEIILRKLD